MRSLLLLSVLALAACDSPPIAWKDPVATAHPADSARLAVDTSGNVRYVIDTIGAKPPVTPCAASVRLARGTTRTFAVWWAVRKDSSANLVVASTADSGKTWGMPSSVDTSDVSSAGCNRPPPSLATVGDDVYVAYSMAASEGTGVFFAHSMGSMLHAPVPVIYGDRLVSTAIAADANRVAVAYEEPNGSRQQIDVAVSATQGHIFELHTVATRDVDVAVLPRVAFDDAIIAVGWTERRSTGESSGDVVRVGRIR
jgi:hypothetical protein